VVLDGAGQPVEERHVGALPTEQQRDGAPDAAI
jgi:hypothetical protein